MRTININSFKKYCEWLSNADMSGGTFPPDAFNNALPFVLNKQVKKYYGNPDQYMPGNPASPISYELSQHITDYIGHLKVDTVLPVDAAGRMVEPSDYMHKSSIAVSYVEYSDETQAQDAVSDCDNTLQATKKQRSTKKLSQKWVPVTVLTDNEWASWTASSLRKPTKEYPICRKFKDYWEFMPLDIKSVRFIYIRYPKAPVWNYTNPSGTYPVFNPTGSVDIELPEELADEFAASMLNRLGINKREGDLINWANFNKQTGNI